MELTIDFIAKNFQSINERYFNNELKTPRFEITHVKSYLGQYHWEYSYDDRIFYDSVIRVSDMFDRTEEDIINTIVHEIIHLYIRQNRIKDTRPHGNVFHTIAHRLNMEGGFHIASTDSVKGCGLRDKSKKETYHVACYKSGRNGRYFSFVFNQNYLEYYQHLFDHNPQHYQNVFMFTSTDDKKYAHYPKCRTSIRGYYIDFDEFNKLKETENTNIQYQTLSKTKVA